MRKIKKLVGHMKDELHDAEHYARDAVSTKDEDRSLGDLYIQLAREELNHCHMEHDQVVRIINERREASEQLREVMIQIWQFEHEQMIEQEAEIKDIMRMYD